jgi:hypothetical protein
MVRFTSRQKEPSCELKNILSGVELGWDLIGIVLIPGLGVGLLKHPFLQSSCGPPGIRSNIFF